MTYVVIIDDEVNARETLAKLLAQHCPGTAVIGEAGSVEEGRRLIRELRPAGVFLDIKMRDGSGFDLLDHLQDIPFHLVFTTAYDQFALRAFRYNAVDYLLKPIDPDELIQACQRIRSNKKAGVRPEQITQLLNTVRSRELNKITLATQKGLIILPLREIIFLESSDNYTRFCTEKENKILVSRTLREFEELLPDNLFFRTHQSFIVNLNFVRMILKEDGGTFAQMTNGYKVPVSRRRKDAFMELLAQDSL